MEYNFDNIQEFYDVLDNAPNSRIKKLMVWSKYQKQLDIDNIKASISNLYYNPRFPRDHYNVILLINGIDMAIIEWVEGNVVQGYSYYINDKKSHDWFDSQDKAIIAALMEKYNGNTDGVQIIFNAMNIRN